MDGYSLRRNNSCHAADQELNCGKTWGTFHRCCPFGTNCAKDGQCRTTNLPPEEKRCANSSWSLYYANDYFCCDYRQKAFKWKENSYVGCAPEGFHLDNALTTLPAIVSGITATSTSTIASSTSQTAGPTTSAASSDSSSSGTNKGAIAGGVVGGVAGVAIIGILFWFVMRRRARSLGNDGSGLPASEVSATSPGPQIVEASNDGLVHEVDGRPEVKHPVHELPAQ
ncbi:hypothetical protein PHISCL_06829 [Aspergillus sclerotialis]|uniref:Glycophorin A domain protein n=1 Tax=Aspergillus sclerotialis TaxID=2070753 RepID=A0A3A2ZCI2_9EURO|nr:hypothetical protein PHISCL_06829 [Aspergillus sclerotialis]